MRLIEVFTYQINCKELPKLNITHEIAQLGSKLILIHPFPLLGRT